MCNKSLKNSHKKVYIKNLAIFLVGRRKTSCASRRQRKINSYLSDLDSNHSTGKNRQII